MDLYKKYSHKLVKIDFIKKKVGKFARKNKIILCHGVFDIVHPGHIRHLTYAKSQCDILVVSCTSDKFIDKGAKFNDKSCNYRNRTMRPFNA